jgi:hypothetical protein
VLLDLIVPGILSYKASVKYFGPATGQRSSLWYEQVRPYIN